MTATRAVARWFWWIVAALVAVRVVSLVAVLLSGQELPHSILGGDARRYGEIVTARGTPYAACDRSRRRLSRTRFQRRDLLPDRGGRPHRLPCPVPRPLPRPPSRKAVLQNRQG